MWYRFSQTQNTGLDFTYAIDTILTNPALSDQQKAEQLFTLTSKGVDPNIVLSRLNNMPEGGIEIKNLFTQKIYSPKNSSNPNNNPVETTPPAMSGLLGPSNVTLPTGVKIQTQPTGSSFPASSQSVSNTSNLENTNPPPPPPPGGPIIPPPPTNNEFYSNPNFNTTSMDAALKESGVQFIIGGGSANHIIPEENKIHIIQLLTNNKLPNTNKFDPSKLKDLNTYLEKIGYSATIDRPTGVLEVTKVKS